MFEKNLFRVVGIGAALALAACGDDDDPGDEGLDNGMADGTGDDDDDDDDDDSAAEMAMIRVIHAASDAPAVDVWVEGGDAPVIENLAYGGASGYLEVPEGMYNFQVRAAGASADDAPVYETGELELPGGATVSALAAGFLGSTDEDDAFRVIPFVEGFDSAGDDEAIVRVIHAGADAPTVDIDVGNDGTPEIEGVARFAETGEAGVPLPAGQSLQVGIMAGGETVTSFTTPELPAGAEIFVIATGQLGALPRQDEGFGLLAVVADGALPIIRQNPTVFAFHGSPDAPAVDICAGDTPLLTDVPFSAMAPIQVPPGSYDLEFHASPSDCTGEPASVQTTPTLEAGQRYFAIATGELAPEGDDPAFQLAAFIDDFDVDAAPEGILRVIHAASAPNVDIGLVANGSMEDAGLLVQDLGWPNVSDAVQVPAATYDIGLVAAGTPLPEAPIASYSVGVTEGMRAFAVAVGDLSADDQEEAFGIFAIDTTATPWVAVEIPAN